MWIRAWTSPVLLAVALLATACATRSPVTVSAAAPPTSSLASPTTLEPSAAAARAGERAELTGMELGRMWTFQDPPLEWWQNAYGFSPTAEWLEHVRLGSVRYGEVCSASFVSPDGLIMTNHHCARGCIEELSSPDADFLEDGFYAATVEEELVCPGLHLDQLLSVEDVTDRVLAAAHGLTADTARARAQSDAADHLEEACEEATGLTCQVVSLYHGGRFHLYQYQRFEPVRLVFAPEHQAASFGGDPDNFTYPRYALDVAFLRAYDAHDRPLTGQPYFRWSPAGVQEGELVFVVGSPGGTNRLLAVSQLMYEKHRQHPFIVQYVQDVVDIYRWIAGFGPEAERSVREELARMENTLKAYSGQLAGLQDTLLVGQKIRWEADLRAAVMADPALRAEYGDAWDRLATIQGDKLPIAQRSSIYNVGFIGDPHLSIAGDLVQLVRQSARPEAERDEGYDDEWLAGTEQALLEATPANPEIAARLLAIRLRLARSFLRADDPFVQEAFRAGESAEQAADRIVGESRIMDPGYRQRVIQGGRASIEAAQDPAIRLARTMTTEHDRLAARLQEIEAAEAAQDERLANALFAVYGTRIPPDATFTLRITDGVMLRYPFNGTVAPAKTSFHGIYERANNFANVMPFTLPRSYEAARNRVDLSVPLNFVTTNDITGGNSGSPRLNRDAQVVGVAFDGNIESLPNEWVFREVAGRAVGVHSAGILEALRSIYRADALVRELPRRGPRSREGGRIPVAIDHQTRST
jgi:hypothetical protein